MKGMNVLSFPWNPRYEILNKYDLILVALCVDLNQPLSLSLLLTYHSSLLPSLPSPPLFAPSLHLSPLSIILNLPISTILTLSVTYTHTQVAQLMDQVLLLQVNERSHFDHKMEKEIHRLR